MKLNKFIFGLLFATNIMYAADTPVTNSLNFMGTSAIHNISSIQSTNAAALVMSSLSNQNIQIAPNGTGTILLTSTSVKLPDNSIISSANGSSLSGLTIESGTGATSSDNGALINITTGIGGSAANGGDLNLTASGGGANGGNILMQSGPAGTAGNGGNIAINAGNGGSASGNPGNISITPGSQEVSPFAVGILNLNTKTVNLLDGATLSSASGSTGLSITSGNGASPSSAGAPLSMRSGNGGLNANGGLVSIVGGSGGLNVGNAGAVNIVGGTTLTIGNGGNVFIGGGNGGATSGNGGNISLVAGNQIAAPFGIGSISMNGATISVQSGSNIIGTLATTSTDFVLSTTGTTNTNVTLTPTGNGIVKVNGNLSLTTAGNKLLVTTGTNGSAGTTAALTAGTITVADNQVTANTICFFTTHTLGTITTPASYYISTRIVSTSLTIVSSNIADTSTVDYFCIN